MKTLFNCIIIIGIAISSSFTTDVLAANTYTVKQQNHMFSEMYLKIENNDVLKFVNLDSVNHKLVFSHKGEQEHMGAIKPGNSQEVTFSQSGIYDIQCKHHPEMKLTIFIPHVVKLNKSAAFYKY
jgi:plastocyanin